MAKQTYLKIIYYNRLYARPEIDLIEGIKEDLKQDKQNELSKDKHCDVHYFKLPKKEKV